MNKLLKGSIAGAAGVALLLGGAGTFAYWNSSATLTGSTIASGNLAVIPDTTLGSWTVNGGTAAIDLPNYLIVPGDVLTYTKTMSILASGDNLVATLALDPASVKRLTESAADAALELELEESVVLAATTTGTGPALVPSTTSPNTFTVTPGAGEIAQDVTVTATITFPKDAAAGAENAAMKGSVTLAAMALTLTQSVN